MSPRPFRLVAGLLSAVALSACVVGPNYHPAAIPPAGGGPFAGAAETPFAPADPPPQWWRLFEAPALDALVQEALAANTDLRIAAANLAQARGVLEEARSGRFPSTNLTSAYSYQRSSAAALGASIPGLGGSGGAFPSSDFYDASLDVSYEVDLFGRVSRTIEAAKRDAQAQAAALDLMRTTVVSETVRAYADACSYAHQLDVARQTLAIQQGTLDLTRRLLEGGRDTALDVAQAATLVETTRATIPTFEGSQRAALYQLSVLTGRTPADIPPAAAACRVTPKVAAIIPVGDGASLIRRRPDVRQADRKLAGAIARIGIATADLYPTVTLGGSVGTSATKFSDLGTDKAFHFSVGPAISWSFPNILVARARIRQNRAAAEGALANFDKTVLIALQDTEAALAIYARELDRNRALKAAGAQASEAVRLASLRQRVGTDTFLSVLTAEQQFAVAQASLAQSDQAVADDQLTLFKALGGGWEDAPPPVRKPAA